MMTSDEAFDRSRGQDVRIVRKNILEPLSPGLARTLHRAEQQTTQL
jgi:hypothetical protein